MPDLTKPSEAYDNEIERLEAENERLRAALEWYGGEAAAISQRLNGMKPTDNPAVIEASLVVLSLDGGKRARNALAAR